MNLEQTLNFDKNNNVYNDDVSKQYNQWIFPNAIDDIAAWVQAGCYLFYDPSLMHFRYWPHKLYPENLDVLVAGCGSSEAAILSYNNPTYNITGIDISESSLSYHQRLKDKHQLDNLTLEHLAIEDIAKLGRTYDLIISMGVIHHTRCPKNSLIALKKQLKDSGIMLIMLYAQYGRIGVYMIQELFREMGLSQNNYDINIAKQLITSLKPNYPNYQTINSFNIDINDNTIIDTFLHPRDVSYNVSNILKLINDVDMSFQNWLLPGLYEPLAVLSENDPLYKKIAHHSKEEQWIIMELLNGSIKKHYFSIQKNKKSVKSYLNLNNVNILDAIPKRMAEKVNSDAVNIPSGYVSAIQAFPQPVVLLNADQAGLYQAFDGKRTLAECFDCVNMQGSLAEKKENGRAFIQQLNRVGAITVGYPNS